MLEFHDYVVLPENIKSNECHKRRTPWQCSQKNCGSTVKSQRLLLVLKKRTQWRLFLTRPNSWAATAVDIPQGEPSNCTCIRRPAHCTVLHIATQCGCGQYRRSSLLHKPIEEMVSLCDGSDCFDCSRVRRNQTLSKLNFGR